MGTFNTVSQEVLSTGFGLKFPGIFSGYDVPGLSGACQIKGDVVIIMKRCLLVILLFLVTAAIISPVSAATSTDPCNIPVIKNLAGPDVIYYDRDGQVGKTFSFSADVQGGTPPYNYTWRFGAGSENMVQGTGPKFASLTHKISDKWVVVSLRVRDSAGKSAAYENNGARDVFTLGWESNEPSSSAGGGQMINVLDPSANPEGGAAYIHKVPTYPYKTPCSSGIEPSAGTSSTATDESGIPWVPVIGVAGVAIASIALAARMRKQKPKDKKKKEEGPVGYILQISPTNTIKVSTSAPGSFTASAWKVDEKGTASPADNASISFVPPAGVPGLSIDPLSGTGSVKVTVSAGEPVGIDTATIQVNATAGGGGTSAVVTVNFEAETSIEFE